MKKTLVALATLAATGAFAQVTIYGIVDASYGRQVASTAAGVQTAIKGISSQQSVSRIGFTGSEELTGGLKANFTLEYYIEPDNGSGIGAGTATGTASTARQAFVGLSGGFGSVNVGNQTTFIALTNGTSDFHGGVNTVGYVIGGNQNSRRSNMIQYVTPTMSGFNLGVQLGYAGANNAETGDNIAYRATYSMGPLNAAAAFETTRLSALSWSNIGGSLNNDFANVTRTVDLSNALSDRKRTSYGLNYDLGMMKVGFTRSEAEAGSSADLGKFEATSFGVSMPVGALTLNATMDTGKLTDSGTVSALSAYQLSAFYALSKRTNLYAIIGEVKNKDTTAKDNQYAIGVRHQF
jgi:predicted porin